MCQLYQTRVILTNCPERSRDLSSEDILLRIPGRDETDDRDEKHRELGEMREMRKMTHTHREREGTHIYMSEMGGEMRECDERELRDREM